MCGCCRVQATGSRICHMGFNRSKLQILHEYGSSFSSTFQSERYHSTAPVWHVFLCSFIVFVRWKSRIIDISNLWVLLQKFCHSLSVLHVPWHTHMKRFQSEIQDKCILWCLDRSEITHQLRSTFCDKCAFFSEFLSIGNSMIAFIRCAKSGIFICMSHPVKFTTVYDCSTDCCSMSVHIFCSRMCHNICSPFDRTTVDRCREGIIHDQRYTMRMRNLCKKLNIQNSKCRIGNRLTKHQLCIWLECRI